MSKLVSIALFLLLLVACKKDSFQEPSDFGYNYQPQELGYWLEYQVDSIFFDDNTSLTTIDTSSYFIREVLDTSYTNASNESEIRVEQYRRDDENAIWTLYHVGSIQFSDSRYERDFNDLRYIALTFPTRENVSWQGNIFIDAVNGDPFDYLNDDLYDWDFTYTEVDKPQRVGGFSLDSCLTIIQIDEENLFEKKFAKEIYARDIGMVYKETQILSTQAPPNGQSFLERVESGFILKYTLKDYKR